MYTTHSYTIDIYNRESLVKVAPLSDAGTGETKKKGGNVKGRVTTFYLYK